MNEWTRRPVVDLIDGLAAGVSVRSVASINGGPSVLKTSAVGAGRFDPREAKSILPADLTRARQIVLAESMVVSRMNTPALVGDVGYVPETHQDLYLPDRLWIARAKRASGTDMRWLTYYFASEPGARELRGLATGTSESMKNIPKGRILVLEINVPPTAEQQEIADALWSIDDVISTLERLIAKKQAIKTGMMQHLLTGKTRLPGFAGEWADGDFSELASLASERVMPSRISGDTPLIELDQIDARSGVLNSFAEASSAVSLKAVFHPGDVLFGKLRAYLRKYWLANTDGICSTEIWVLQTKPDTSSLFLRYVVESEPFIELASGAYGTHMPRSDWNQVRNLKIQIPTFDEQNAIGRVLADADAEIEVLRAKARKARAIKQAMMQQLLTGRTRLPVEAAA